MDFNHFLTGFLGSSAIEITAALAGFLCVYLIIKRSIWCWPVGLLQVVLYLVVFYQARLYSDAILHVIYIGMQFYGWWYWLQGRQQDGLQVKTASFSLFSRWLVVAVAGSALLGYVMSTYTDASLPYPDAFTTVASLVAQWLLSRRHLINWLFWIAVDLVAIGIYWQKGLYPTTILYGCFLVMAVFGLLFWLKAYQHQRLNAVSDHG